MSNINERIIQVRESKFLKQKDFAEIIDVARSSLSEIENGKRCPSIDFIVHISNKFPDISLDWLLTGEGCMYKNSSTPELKPDEEALLMLYRSTSAETRKEILFNAAAKERTKIDSRKAA